ncbi:MAG: hypothetical protein Q9220_005167 [cf. Caloplaca sp. 1 TL-2023]
MAAGQDSGVDTSKPTAIFEPSIGRAYTVSVALPGSIIANALTPELKTLLAGQIARALAVFCVDEVVVFDDGQQKQPESYGSSYQQNGRDEFTGYSDPNYFLMHLLSFLETPPFLRKHLFPAHSDLQLSGALPSLDMPHHLRSKDWCPYREGIAVEPVPEEASRDGGRQSPQVALTESTLVDVGLARKARVSVKLLPGTRLTVKLPDEANMPKRRQDPIPASAVAPSQPREEAGYYWGYNVRSASCLSAVITESNFPEGYDLTFGTSERGSPISELMKSVPGQSVVPEFNHMLLVFGGVAGLETAFEADTELQKMGVKEVKDLFDFWINLCPGQGSRTIRTEEAVWLGLMGLRELVLSRGRR